MWDDDFFDGVQKKKSDKFFTYEEWGITLKRSAEFEAYLDKQKMSHSALRTYPADVADFHAWVQDHYRQGLPRRLYRDHVIAYRDALVKRRVKPQTINHKLSALRKYNAYLMAHQYQRGEVFKRGDFLKIKPRKPKALTIRP
jgi:site-specific recombinase XerD